MAKYAKTMAAFANRDGGYIIYGVKNNPRIVVGMRDNIFDEYDDAKSEAIATYFYRLLFFYIWKIRL
mgnify:CR=1 FL=1